jgi:hypothetical protein
MNELTVRPIRIKQTVIIWGKGHEMFLLFLQLKIYLCSISFSITSFNMQVRACQHVNSEAQNKTKREWL